MGKFPRKVIGYKCEECDIIREDKEDFKTIEVFYTKDVLDDLTRKEDLEEVDCYECPECQALIAEGDLLESEMWECVDCEEKYEDRDEAYHCCE